MKDDVPGVKNASLGSPAVSLPGMALPLVWRHVTSESYLRRAGRKLRVPHSALRRTSTARTSSPGSSGSHTVSSR